MSNDNIVKVGDLNVSKLARQDGLNYTQAGTPYYARFLFKFSPEVKKDTNISTSELESDSFIIFFISIIILYNTNAKVRQLLMSQVFYMLL